MSARTLTQAELVAEAKTHFGNDPEKWAFACPNCGDVAVAQDFRRSGMYWTTHGSAFRTAY